MAAHKPVTNDDVAVEATADGGTVEDGEYVKVKSPFGDVTTVPVGILDALLESGYSKSK
jgi:hypothetical protein